jgi:succinate dehydrogenase / fumarate reductase cytochrome b subunit
MASTTTPATGGPAGGATTKPGRDKPAGAAPVRPPSGPEPIRKLSPSALPILRFYRTAVGKKWVMAITGAILMSFVLVHLIGNIKLYLSKEELNLYGEALRNMPGHLLPRTWLLWFFRIGLILSFALHIHAAYGLTVINYKARPSADKYKSRRDYVAADFASRTMRWTGIIVALYLVFHLLDLTWGGANPEYLRGDPYNNVIYSMQRPAVALVYLLANIALGIHLYHGAWSMFQSMGVTNPRINNLRRRFAQAFAAIIIIGNCSFPIAVQLHLVELECPQTDPVAACASE